MKSGNPALSTETFKEVRQEATQDGVMTVNGTINKTGLLFLVLLLCASISWINPSALFVYGGAFGGLIVAFITIFKKEWAPITAPIYAGLEGFFLGTISLAYAGQYQGIVFNAVLLTLGIFAAMLFIYQTGIIQVTQKFRMGVVAATGGIMLVYFASFILQFFGVSVGLVYGDGLAGIGFSLVIVVIAALNLVLDFDMIEKGVAASAPKYFEWYTSFGLVVTLVWLYLEILRLLGKMRH